MSDTPATANDLAAVLMVFATELVTVLKAYPELSADDTLAELARRIDVLADTARASGDTGSPAYHALKMAAQMLQASGTR